MLTENDPAGMGIAFTHAINRYTDHRCRLVSCQERYGINFEKDIYAPDIKDDNGFQTLDGILKDADIFHFHILSDETMSFGSLRVKDYIKGKKIIHHHHGHPEFRANPDSFCAKYRDLGRKMLVSTPDLHRMAPESTWIPNIVPLDHPLFMPAQTRRNGKVKICQAPTRKDLKNTDDFIHVTDRLKLRLPQIERVIIEQTQYQDCLNEKKTCHIHFDHMQGYYGVSSLESLSQGKPVIAGLDDWNTKYIKRFTGRDSLPWCIAKNREELEKTIENLVMDPYLCDDLGKQSRDFMVNVWNEKRVLDILFQVYSTL
ncbi:MAG: glycosyltransferase family 1 protein [Proteobacteria bacterium]|nr:glycosyltransferase family 1 protein [Pseudomonadota bacterium]